MIINVTKKSVFHPGIRKMLYNFLPMHILMFYVQFKKKIRSISRLVIVLQCFVTFIE